MCHNTVLWLGRLSFWAHDNLVLASDVMATDCWLNVWCIWQTKLETLQDFQSHHWIGWMCVMLFNDLLGSQTKVFTTVTMSTSGSGSTKCCIFKSIWNMLSLWHRLFNIWPRVVHTVVCYSGDISTWHKTKRDWLLYVSIHMAHMFPDLLPSVWKSGYARLISTSQTLHLVVLGYGKKQAKFLSQLVMRLLMLHTMKWVISEK